MSRASRNAARLTEALPKRADYEVESAVSVVTTGYQVVLFRGTVRGLKDLLKSAPGNEWPVCEAMTYAGSYEEQPAYCEEIASHLVQGVPYCSHHGSNDEAATWETTEEDLDA